MNKLIGYRGIESPEIIFYTSRILYNLGLKVVMCDYSPADEMKYYIPLSEEIDTEKHCVDYRGVAYTKQNISKIQLYDVYLVNYGFADYLPEMNACDLTVFLTDTNKANLKKLGRLQTVHKKNNKTCHLVIRDILSDGINIKPYKRELENILGVSTSYEIMFDKNDFKRKEYLQYNTNFNFRNVSPKLYNYLVDTIEEHLYECFEQYNLKKAVQRAMKGV